MVRRIFHGRVIPLLMIFFGSILTNLLMSIRNRGLGSSITIMWILLAALYLWIFVSFLRKYVTFRRRIRK